MNHQKRLSIQAPATLLVALLVGAPACSDNHAASADERDAGGWSLGGIEGQGDAGEIPSSDMQEGGGGKMDSGLLPFEDMGFSPTDMGPGRFDMDLLPPDDMAPSPTDMSPVGVDMPAPFDLGPAVDMSTPVDAGMVGGMEGDGCGNTPDCSDGLVCCASFNGQYTCTPEARCFSGGLCEMNSDCPDQQECCDYSEFGIQQKTCRDQCPGNGGGGGGGGGMQGCMNNSECPGADEVCCPSFGGAAMCTPSSQCQTGGSCAVDTDCLNGQSCCDFFGQVSICFDQCSF